MRHFKKFFGVSFVLLFSTNVWSAEAIVRGGLDLANNNPNKYMRCLTTEFDKGRGYKRAARVCRTLLGTALQDLPDDWHANFISSTKSLFMSGELKRNGRASEQRASSVSRVAREQQMSAVLREFPIPAADDRDRNQRGLSRALQSYANCVGNRPVYLSNLEQAKEECASERAYADSLAKSEDVDDALRTMDLLLMRQWQNLSARAGVSQ